MFTTLQMGLKAWDLAADKYDHNQLVENWIAIDGHDHTPGKGTRLIGQSLVEATLTQRELGPCSVNTDELCDESVSTAKLKKCSVTTPEICNDAVTNPKMADSSVGTAELIAGSVTNPKIADAAVSETKLDTASVSNTKIKDGAVSEGKLAPNAVTNVKMADNSVGTVEVINGAITTGKVANAAITPPKVGIVPCARYVTNGARGVSHLLDHDFLQFDGPNYATGVDVSNYNRIGIQYPGIYLVTAGIRWGIAENGDVAGTRVGRLWKNETVIAGDSPKVYSGPATVRMSMSTTIDAGPGDYFRVSVRTVETDAFIVGENGLTHLSVCWLGPRPF